MIDLDCGRCSGGSFFFRSMLFSLERATCGWQKFRFNARATYPSIAACLPASQRLTP
jgi:hypothetical protein